MIIINRNRPSSAAAAVDPPHQPAVASIKRRRLILQTARQAAKHMQWDDDEGDGLNRYKPGDE